MSTSPQTPRNFACVGRDNLGVKCEDCREALSARIDGEDEQVPAALIDQHLTGCLACRQWQQAAEALSRTIRVRPVVPTPDLTERILAAAEPPQPQVRRQREFFRWALGGVAFIQLSLALAQLLGVDHTAHLAVGTGEHLFNESSAWNLGVAIGLLAAAARPALARGLLPALAVFVAVLFAVSVADVVAGNVGLDRLVSHATVVIGLCLLFLVDRQYRRHPLPGVSVDATTMGNRSVSLDHDSADGDHADPEASNRPGRWLRPAGRHAA